MPELEKAKIQPVQADRNNSPAGDEFDVQFNPTSLKLRLTNQSEGGDSRARQRRQHTSSGSTTLTMELVFDSADETGGDAGAPQPVSVRHKTGQLEQFVVPREEGGETPPRMKFSWNELVVVGIVESLDITFDLFAPSGEPLRAKVSLAIKEQEPKYQFLEAGAGARDNANAEAAGGNADTQPGAGTNDPQSQGPASTQTGQSNAGDRSAAALEGETAPEFAARQGLDPAAWRGLDVDLSAGLTLEAGVEVGFSAGLSVSAGVGVSVGVQAGADLSLTAAVGLEAGASVNVTGGAAVSANTAAGFALSAAGGVTAAIEVARQVEAQSAAQEAAAAFETPRTALTAGGNPVTTKTTGYTAASLRAAVQPAQDHTPLVQSGPRSYSVQQAAPGAPAPPTADDRAATYGYGVPLKPVMGGALTQGQPRVCGASLTNGTRRTNDGPGFRRVPTTSPWVRLPLRSPGRENADRAQQQKRPHPCGFLYAGKGERP